MSLRSWKRRLVAVVGGVLFVYLAAYCVITVFISPHARGATSEGKIYTLFWFLPASPREEPDPGDGEPVELGWRPFPCEVAFFHLFYPFVALEKKCGLRVHALFLDATPLNPDAYEHAPADVDVGQLVFYAERVMAGEYFRGWEIPWRQKEAEWAVGAYRLWHWGGEWEPSPDGTVDDGTAEDPNVPGTASDDERGVAENGQL